MTQKPILIVEDDDWLAKQQAKSLSLAGYQVSVVPHALAAIDMIDKIKPVVIVLDMLLAGYNALTLMHELQSYGDTAEIPIILCTNIASSLKISDVRPYGVHRILDKTTMQPDDLVIAVRGVLES